MELNHLGLGVVIFTDDVVGKALCVGDGVKCGWVAGYSFPGTLSRTAVAFIL